MKQVKVFKRYSEHDLESAINNFLQENDNLGELNFNYSCDAFWGYYTCMITYERNEF